MATLQPLAGRIVIKRAEAITRTASGLFIIDNDANRPNLGKVLAVAPDVQGVAVGDEVLYDHTVGTEIKVDGVQTFVLHENNLFGVARGSDLVPLKNTILFKFLDETGGSKGEFSERTRGVIIIPTLKKEQTAKNRWGQVVSVGPDVANIAVGEYVLIAAQQWNRAENWNGEKVWKTVDIDTAVLAVTDDVAETVEF